MNCWGGQVEDGKAQCTVTSVTGEGREAAAELS